MEDGQSRPVGARVNRMMNRQGGAAMTTQRAAHLVDVLAEELRRAGWADLESGRGRVRHILRKRHLGTLWLLALVDGAEISEEHAQQCVEHFGEVLERHHEGSNDRLYTGFITFKQTFGTMLFVLDGSPERIRWALGRTWRTDTAPTGFLGQSLSALACLTVDIAEQPPRARGRVRVGRYPSRRRLLKAIERCRGDSASIDVW
jgi:hypothetical protein